MIARSSALLAHDIADILDSDCDETKVALYNPRATVARIRERIEQELSTYREGEDQFEAWNRSQKPEDQVDD